MVVIHDVIVVEVVVVKMIMMMLWRKNWSDDVVECSGRLLPGTLSSGAVSTDQTTGSS